MKSICIKTVSPDKVDFLVRQLENLEINIFISTYRFKVYDNVIIHYPDENVEEFYNTISEVIKNTIEFYYEEEFIIKNIKQNYFYLEEIEQEYILKITKKILELPDKKIGYKNKVLKRCILNYLKENKSIIIEGFVNFRIGDYKKKLDNIIEVSVFSYLDLKCF